ncbi:MAG: hypothetical protein V3T98_01090 [Candidatus Paceibacterota bacterium]
MNISIKRAGSKIGFIIILIILISPAFLTTKAAITPGKIPSAGDLGLPASPVQDVGGLVGIIDSILVVTYITALCLAILFIIFAAINYLGAAGDTEKIKKAHHQIIYALIAIAVTLISVGAVQIVKSIL